MEHINRKKLFEKPTQAFKRFFKDDNDIYPPPPTEIDLDPIKDAARGALLAGSVLASAASPADAIEVAAREPQSVEEVIVADEAREKAIRCLTENVYHEARGEIDEGKLAVALVTLGRTLFKGYPSDVCGVVYQSKQFSWTFDKKILEKPIDAARFEKIRALLTERLEGKDVAEAVVMLSMLLDLPINTIFYKRVGFEGSTQVQGFFGTLRSVRIIGNHEFFARK